VKIRVINNMTMLGDCESEPLRTALNKIFKKGNIWKKKKKKKKKTSKKC